MVRMNLSGEWELRLDYEKVGLKQEFYGDQDRFEDSIVLPGTTSEQQKGERVIPEKVEAGCLTEPFAFEGYVWLKKEIEVPSDYVGMMAVLLLERTRISNVWVNGKFVGSLDTFCGFHRYEIGKFLVEGKNSISIMVSNVDYKTTGGHMTSRDTQTNWNGILGELSLSFYEGIRIEDVQCYSSFENRWLKVDTELVADNDYENVEFEIVCKRRNCEQRLIEFHEVKSIESGRDTFQFSFHLDEAHILEEWNEYSPVLYEVSVMVRTAHNKLIDSKTVTIGFRDIHTKGRRFYLNDLEVMFRGKHDGMIFPLTGYAPMNKDEWLKTFRIAKEYGINHYRFHTCCPPKAAFEAADELGMYLEPELPFWGTVYAPDEEDYDAERQEFLEEEGVRILREFGNHPSFLMFSLGNELWGSHKVIDGMLKKYKEMDDRHWYTEGSNNFQFVPVILDHDDFFCGVRFSRERLFRGSYAMCDAPQGHVQVSEPEMCHNYDEIIVPKKETGAKAQAGEIQIQYQTGVKTVKAEEAEELISEIPVISHEVGQYETFPDFDEIEKYTGVLKAENFRLFRSRLEEKGMLSYAKMFFEASGKLAVQCYKRELETAFRSQELSGFQLLDLQDFSGQGTALVGILNAFMENKGLIEAKDWRRFCSDRVLMLAFPKFVYQAGELFSYEILFSNMNPQPLSIEHIRVTVRNMETNEQLEQNSEVHITEKARLMHCGKGEIELPMCTMPQKMEVTVKVEDMDIQNQYEIYVYPECLPKCNDESSSALRNDALQQNGLQQEDNGTNVSDVVITDDKEVLKNAVKDGKTVLFFGTNVRPDKTIQGTYCTDFWCYPMFASISESVNKPKPIGTMGMYLRNEHKAFAYFPTDSYTTPQWWKIITDAPLVMLDETDISPIAMMIDNFDRNHKLGVIFEAHVENGKVLFCQANIKEGTSLEEKWLYHSLLSYAGSPDFEPEDTLTFTQIDALY